MPKIASSSLTPASVIDEPRLGRADHRRAHRERGAERVRVVAAHDGVAVVHVHERVRAGLQLGEHAELVVEVVRARAAARDDPRREALGAEPLDEADERLAATRASARACARSRRCSGGRRRSPARRRTRARRSPRRAARAQRRAPSSARPVRRPPTSMSTSTWSGRPERRPAAASWATLAGSSATTIRSVGARIQRRQPLELRRRDDGGEEHHAGDAGVGHHLRLGQRRAAHADAAGRDLAPRDVDRLVHLRDGPQRVAVRLRRAPRAMRCWRRGRPDRARARACRARSASPAGRSGARWGRGSTARA